MGTFGHFSPPVAAIAAALALAGCSGGSLGGGWGFSSSDQPPQAEQPGPEIPATIRVSEVIGRWGYAAFHKQEDRARTEAAARSQCNHPFVIGQGPSARTVSSGSASPVSTTFSQCGRGWRTVRS